MRNMELMVAEFNLNPGSRKMDIVERFWPGSCCLHGIKRIVYLDFLKNCDLLIINRVSDVNSA